MKEKNISANPLWTRDFTIITLGSVVSMLGNALSGFAMSLLVLDYTGSTFYYALYMVIYMLPRVVMPVLSGPVLDRFSRRRAIYTLDFCSAGLYLVMGLILKFGSFHFAGFALACFLIGSIDSVYSVAYDSFYPLLISEGNYSKAYSISSVLETMTMLMMPVSALVYNSIGIVPLFFANAVSFFAAAIAETQIRADERYILEREQESPRTERGVLRRFGRDLKDGLSFLLSERGLLAVTLYFAVSSFSGGASEVIGLPYFKKTFPRGEYVFMLVWGMTMVGRMIGGWVHYKIKFPVNAKYGIALMVYIVISCLEGTYLYCPLWAMMVMCFFIGILGVTSYNIRISATQSYVADSKKGRFNGIFSMMNTVGMLAGQLLSGTLTLVLSERAVLSAFMGVTAVAAVVFIGGNRKAVSAIYNTQA
jgi:MFS family permease